MVGRGNREQALGVLADLLQLGQDPFQRPAGVDGTRRGFHLPAHGAGKRQRIHQGDVRFGHLFGAQPGSVVSAAQAGRNVDGQEFRDRPWPVCGTGRQTLRWMGWRWWEAIGARDQFVELVRADIHTAL